MGLRKGIYSQFISDVLYKAIVMVLVPFDHTYGLLEEGRLAQPHGSRVPLVATCPSPQPAMPTAAEPSSLIVYNS